MDKVFSPLTGVLLLFILGLLFYFITRFFTEKSYSRQDFLVANHNMSGWQASFSIAATWIWAPALFVAAEQAYINGIAGVFWFTVPNVLCLIIFAFFSMKVREVIPEGYTISGYMRERFSSRVQSLYLVELSGLAICSFAVQLLAGGKVISTLTGINFLSVTILMTIMALIYAVFSGIKASIVTDYIQMIMILLVSAIIVPWTIIISGGTANITQGLGGITGDFSTIFSGNSLSVAYSFGIPVTIGLLAGPFGDQSFWQRAFSIKKEEMKSSFIRGAFIFAVIPILMSILGFIAAGKGWDISDTGLVNLEVVIRLLPLPAVILFFYMLICGLISTIDSNLCAISSLAGYDLTNRKLGHFNSKERNKDLTREADLMSMRFAKTGMFILAILSILIANLPGVKIVHLFLFYGTVRATVLIPTVLSILFKKISERGIFWGIIISFVIGLPMFVLGKLGGSTDWEVAGALFTVFSSGIITAVVSFYYKGGKHELS